MIQLPLFQREDENKNESIAEIAPPSEDGRSSLAPTSPPTSTTESNAGAWAVFASTFITIFFAEFGDKTQLATLLIAAESHSPWIVFIGAGSALVATSLLGVLVGRWLARRVSPKTIEKSAGIVLLLLAASLFWDILR
ncbi:TMEM165/GDT1 family protein [Oxynema aestuarii]|jgi:putative Ca2+/H+ antiporter (TMEM165/GDT1 family)|uniref:GDT1 family protein n=1 Tax=Oxynema aestuarii AP17 TaxID=2064643 RepID=A0A6H1TYS7_9CYAN|nr:TMEM165/GDT1 family protein [Oxynema aestuarii]QIZ71731.1 TMEM165/GDT1 family protein [Oxynema aestuarii AP17]RMH79028.1 MAG: TMEM165/GDT1 family protein [Cyanobacteria bacterium J007]